MITFCLEDLTNVTIIYIQGQPTSDTRLRDHNCGIVCHYSAIVCTYMKVAFLMLVYLYMFLRVYFSMCQNLNV